MFAFCVWYLGKAFKERFRTVLEEFICLPFLNRGLQSLPDKEVLDLYGGTHIPEGAILAFHGQVGHISMVFNALRVSSVPTFQT